jgi:hypothetical protein
LPNIIHVFSNWLYPGFIFTGAFFSWLLLRSKFRMNVPGILTASVFLYALFMAGIPIQSMRFQLLSFPLILVLFFPAAQEMAIRFPVVKEKAWPWFLVALVQLMLFTRAFMPFHEYNRLEKAMADEVKKYPAKTIYTFETESALQSYGVTNKIVGLWNQKLDTIQVHSLLLFNEKKFESQWKGKNVMINYETIIQRKRVTPIKKFADGWQLSELE